MPKIKGTHTAMKSGMVAAEAAFDALKDGAEAPELDGLSGAAEASWLWDELHGVRNIRPAFHWGLCRRWPTRRSTPTYCAAMRPGRWGIRPTTRPCAGRGRQPIDYPRPDGKMTFDRLSSVFLSNTNHEEDQPVHLRLKDSSVAERINLARYDGPEQRYCPAGVYEFVAGLDGARHLQINAQNCVHCKTCDIKDPTQNIDWVTPEGGGGPNYIGGM